MAWDTRSRGRNLKVIKLSPEEMAATYGAPLTGRAKVEAESEAMNLERWAGPRIG